MVCCDHHLLKDIFQDCSDSLIQGVVSNLLWLWLTSWNVLRILTLPCSWNDQSFHVIYVTVMYCLTLPSGQNFTITIRCPYHPVRWSSDVRMGCLSTATASFIWHYRSFWLQSESWPALMLVTCSSRRGRELDSEKPNVTEKNMFIFVKETAGFLYGAVNQMTFTNTNFP